MLTLVSYFSTTVLSGRVTLASNLLHSVLDRCTAYASAHPYCRRDPPRQHVFALSVRPSVCVCDEVSVNITVEWSRGVSLRDSGVAVCLQQIWCCRMYAVRTQTESVGQTTATE